MRGLNWSEGVNEALGVGLGQGLKRPLRWEGRGRNLERERSCGSCHLERDFGK